MANPIYFPTGIDLGAFGQAVNFALQQLGSDPASPRTSQIWWLNGVGPRVYDGSAKHSFAFLDTTLNSFATPTANISLGGYNITSLADPVNAQDAATKNFVLSVVQGETWLVAVKAATTAPITLSGAQTIDGVSVVAGDRVFVKNQASTQTDGIYVVADPGAWSYAADWVTGNVISGCVVPVSAGGTTNGATLWKLTTSNPITVGTTPLTFVQIPVGGSYSAANIGGGTVGVFAQMSGNQFQFNTISSANNAIGLAVNSNVITITFSAGNVGINSLDTSTPLAVAGGGTGAGTVAGAKSNLGFMSRYAASFGDGTNSAFTLTHGLGTLDVTIEVFNNSTGAKVYPDIYHAGINTATIDFGSVVPTTNQFRLVVIG